MSVNDGLNENQVELLERLAILANIFQVENYFLNMQEVSNNELMKALELQNKNYLEQILVELKEIKETLKDLTK